MRSEAAAARSEAAPCPPPPPAVQAAAGAAAAAAAAARCPACAAGETARVAQHVDDATSAAAIDLGLRSTHADTPLVMLTFGNKAVRAPSAPLPHTPASRLSC